MLGFDLGRQAGASGGKRREPRPEARESHVHKGRPDASCRMVWSASAERSGDDAFAGQDPFSRSGC